jgi:hypothetical protein
VGHGLRRTSLGFTIAAGACLWPAAGAIPGGAQTGPIAESHSAQTLERRLVTTAVDGSVHVLVSVPVSLRGGVLPPSAFTARVGERTVPVVASRVATTALHVDLVIDPLGPAGDLATVQGATVEFLLGLPDTSTVRLLTPSLTTPAATPAATVAALRGLTMTSRPTLPSLLAEQSTDTVATSDAGSGAGPHRVVVVVTTGHEPSTPVSPETPMGSGEPVEVIGVGPRTDVGPTLARSVEASGGQVTSVPDVADLLQAYDRVNSDVASLYTVGVKPAAGDASVALAVASPAGDAQVTIPLGPTSAATRHTRPAPTPARHHTGTDRRRWIAALALAVVALATALAATLARRWRADRARHPADAVTRPNGSAASRALDSLDRLAVHRRQASVRIPRRLLVAIEAAASDSLDHPRGPASDPAAALARRPRPGGAALARRIDTIEATLNSGQPTGTSTDGEPTDGADAGAPLLPDQRHGPTSGSQPTSIIDAARHAAQLSRSRTHGSDGDEVGRSFLATWPARAGLVDHIPMPISRALADAGITRSNGLELDDQVALLVAAVGDAAERTLRAEVELSRLRDRYVAALLARGEGDRAEPIVSLLLSEPVITIDAVVAHLGASPTGARQGLDELTADGWLARLESDDPSQQSEWLTVEVVDIVIAAFDDQPPAPLFGRRPTAISPTRS